MEIMEGALSVSWEEISDTLTINDIEDFSKQIKKLGMDYHYPPLYQWAEELYSQTMIFDVEALPHTLERFTDIRAGIQKLIEESSSF